MSIYAAPDRDRTSIPARYLKERIQDPIRDKYERVDPDDLELALELVYGSFHR